LRRMKRILKNQGGAILITYALLLTVLLGFTALGVEAGRWYLVRSELSKAVDAAAMAGAKNISNPYVTDVEALAREVGEENFRAGQLGTPAGGAGSISFTFPPREGTSKFKVVGQVSAIAFLAQLFGIHQVATSSTGVAQFREVEIMMVLDKSFSMAGTPMTNLKAAAISFLSFFEQTQDADKMGLISFNTAASVDHPLSTYFVNDMTTKINAITTPSTTSKRRATNAEDAISKSGDQLAGGFTDQTGVAADQRIQQYLVFFTDGNPTAFTSKFTYGGGTSFDAVVYATPTAPYTICDNSGLSSITTGDGISVQATPTGDGKPAATSTCHISNTKWNVFVEYPLTGYGPESCNIPNNPSSYILGNYLINTARKMAIARANELKAKGIKIYAIGFTPNVDQSFLRDDIASGPEFYYYTPDSGELEAIFNKIAKEIRLRLVE
jgi:Putative Flp pilus-assembly TadE/G-like/von Willebrand factor type A domain